ncbi:MAG: AraC family transcriptional regulator [Phycisphaera sp.]|nr:AraC family transcriptional regulator [Phycisphaera sp.]
MGQGYTVKIENIDSRPLAVVRRRAARDELSKVVPQACGQVWDVVRSDKIPGAGRHVAVYLDEEIRLEVGVELESPLQGEHGEVVASATPKGTVATTRHLGPYPELHRAHEAVRSWCDAKGHTPAGKNWEFYGHWKNEWNNNPSLIETDVFYLLKNDALPD